MKDLIGLPSCALGAGRVDFQPRLKGSSLGRSHGTLWSSRFAVGKTLLGKTCLRSLCTISETRNRRSSQEKHSRFPISGYPDKKYRTHCESQYENITSKQVSLQAQVRSETMYERASGPPELGNQNYWAHAFRGLPAKSY